MSEDRSYKVFVSYSTPDRQWATEFVETLRDAGVDAWFDAFELMPGDRLQERIEQALRESETFIAIISS